MTVPTAEELSAVPLFASLSPKDLGSTAQLFTVRSYPKGAIVANEGDRLEMFHFILSGNVQAFVGRSWAFNRGAA